MDVLKIKKKLFLAFGMGLAATLVVGFFGMYSTSTMVDEVRGIHEMIYSTTAEGGGLSEEALREAIDGVEEIGHLNMVISIVLLLGALIGGISIVIILTGKVTSPISRLVRMVGDMSGALSTSSNQLNDVAEKMEDDTNRVLGQASIVSSAAIGMSKSMSTMAETSNSATSNVNDMSSAVEAMSNNMSHIAATTGNVSSNATTVATAIEEMSATISEITKNTAKAARISSSAENKSLDVKQLMVNLGESAKAVGEVVGVINDIAERTNILSLNATIEAASAGEAGKGFAVVANEVKELSKQTAKATEEVVGYVEKMQSNTDTVVSAIEEIGIIIHDINDINISIATAVEEQDATTTEVSKSTVLTVEALDETTRNIEEAANGAEDLAKNAIVLLKGIEDISRSSSETAEMTIGVSESIEEINTNLEQAFGRSMWVKKKSGELSNISKTLSGILVQFGDNMPNPQSFQAEPLSVVPSLGDTLSPGGADSSAIEPLIVWDESFSVNVGEIDHQHKKLIAFINDLNEAMLAGRGKAATEKVLEELINYTADHFKFEEDMFAKHSYDETAAHVREHKAFVETALKMQEDFHNGKPVLVELMKILKSWLMNHILVVDMKYKPFFNERGVN